MKHQIFSDEHFRKAIQTTVCLIVFCCIVSQIMMQLAGGERDEPLDLSDQVPQEMQDNGGLVFEDGYPPFVSSAGALMPEKFVFNLGLFSGGVMMIFLTFEIYHRTKFQNTTRKFANLSTLLTGIIVGYSMVQIVAYPFTTEVMSHIFWAMNIFWFAQIWMGSLAYTRGTLDAQFRWRGWKINTIRWTLFSIAVISFQAMTALTVMNLIVESAIFEWTLIFSAFAMMLTIIPTLDPVEI
tara:strand:- start:1238 stop:1954 length:717 start_codon:yes stop_codon:yes gene_type:complete